MAWDPTPTVNRALAASTRHSGTLFVLLAAAAFAAILFLGRHGTFYGDEWHFIEISGIGDVRDWVTPWNEHWTVVPMVIYRTVFLVFGLNTYLPYLAVLLVAHIAAAAGLFVLVRNHSGPAVALLFVTVFLFLGSGYANLFWAFQIGFVISTAAGLWALVTVDQSRHRAAAVLLMIALASSGMGVPFAAAVGIRCLVDTRTRGAVLWLVPVAALYVGWWWMFGREGEVSASAAAGWAGLSAIPSFLTLGVVSTLDGLFGLGHPIGIAVAAATVLAFVVQVRRRTISPLAAGAAAGFGLLLCLLAMGRGQYGVSTTAQPRYLYESAVFVLLLLSSLVGRRADPIAGGPGAWARGRPAWAVLVTAVVLLAAVGFARNVQALPGGAAYFSDFAGALRGQIAWTEALGSRLTYNPPMPETDPRFPSPDDLDRLMARSGRPDTDVLRPGIAMPVTHAQMDRALWRLVGGTLAPVGTSSPGTPHRPPVLRALTGATWTVVDDCSTLEADGRMPRIVLTAVVADGQAIDVRLDHGGAGSIALGHLAAVQNANSLPAQFPTDEWRRIHAPTIGVDTPFDLRLTFPDGVHAATVCEVMLP